MFKRLPLLIAVCALAGWAGSFIVKTFLANSLITYGQGEESRTAAVGYAPNNADVLAARARYLLYRADPPQPEQAIRDLQAAVAASPYDYRYQLELGKAYQGDGQMERAGEALQQAVTLAPRYFETRWALANHQLRTGQTDAALNEFREALQLSGSLYDGNPRPNYNAAMNSFTAVTGALGLNLEALRRITPPDAVSQTYLAEFLATHDALEAALPIWRSLPANEPSSYYQLLFQLLRELQAKQRYDDAHEVWNKLAAVAGVATNSTDNLMSDPGFERAPLSEAYPVLADSLLGFDWILRRHPEVRVRRISGEAHQGNYALQLSFNASMNSEFQDVSQLVAVEPGRAYKLSYFVKTQNASPLPNEAAFVEITDAAEQTRFALRSVVPGGTNNWQPQSLTFTTLPDTRALRIVIRNPQIRTVDLARVAEIWFDDFALEKQN